MIILVKLEMEGFRSFFKRTIVNFPSRGAILIKGKWKNRNISSGSGKSSILLAIAFALGFCSVPATALKNWESKSIFVSLTLKNTETGDVYIISRSPKLDIKINDVSIAGSNEEKEGQIQKIIKTSLDLAKVLTYREQRKPGVFINSTDAKKKDFLSTVLGLYEVEAALDSFNKELSDYKVTQNGYSSSITTLKDVLSTTTISEEEFEQARTNFEALQVRLNELLNNKEKLQQFASQKTALQQESTKIQSVKVQKNNASFKNQNIKNNVMKAKAEVDTLKQNICPTCKRHWDNCNDLITHKEKQIQDLIAEMRMNITIIKNADPIIESEPKIQQEMINLDAAIATIQVPAQDAQQACSTSKMHYEELSRKKQSYLTNQQKLNDYDQTLQQTEKDMGLTELSISLLGRNGFLGSIFDEVLIDIENKTNIMISRIPNVENFYIKFPSTKITGKGTIKKSINTEIYKSGKKVPLKALSGGQECAFELCSDLASAETIRERSGSKLGWIGLDEAMDGLDIEPKSCALEVIKEQIKGQILIIDHATEVKEGFEKVIEVEYDGKRSYIVGE